MEKQDRWSKIKKHFEENMLDGDDVNDCGDCQISAMDVLNYIQDYYDLLLPI